MVWDAGFVDALGADGIVASGDEDFRLRNNSPNVDAGRDVIRVHQDWVEFQFVPDRDLDSKARFQDGDGDGTPTIDIGAYEQRPARDRARHTPWNTPSVGG